MSDTTPDAAPPRSGMQLWYCNACTRLINPPGSEGVMGADGNRYCPKCAPAKAAASPDANKQGSRAVILAAKSPTDPQIRAAHSQAHGTHGHSHAAPKQNSTLAFVLDGAAIFVVGVLFFAFSGSRESDPKVATLPLNTAPQTPSQPNQPVPNQNAIRAEQTPPSDRPPLPTGGLFGSLNAGGGEKREPGSAQPTPQNTDAGKPAPPPTQPVASPAQPAPAAKRIEDLTASLNTARDQANAARYSQALATLKTARETFSGADWWAAQQKSVSDQEARVQQQLADFTAEVEDLRGRVVKSDSLEFLAKTEREWTERLQALAGSSTPPLWILMEPHAMQSSGGATLTAQPGASILLSGANPAQDTLTFTTRIERRDVTAVRIEALPHPSFAANGPGRAENGNYALSRVRIGMKDESAPDPAPQLSLSNPSFDFGQGGSHPNHVLDEDPNSTWAIVDQRGLPHWLVIQTGNQPAGTGPFLLTVVMEHSTPWGQHVIGHLRLSYSTNPAPPPATDGRGREPAIAFSSDPLVQRPVQKLLAQILERRKSLAVAGEAKRIAEVNQNIEAVEKQMKSRAVRTDVLLKGLDAIEAQLPENQEVALPLVERIAGLRFDAATAKDGEISMYGANARTMGGGVELLYDFSTPEQYWSWTADLPNGGGGSWYDAKAGHAKLLVANKRNWDNDDRRNAPIFWLPFYFDQNNWVFEASMSLVDDKRAGSKPHFGILMWDGKHSARLYLRENSGRDMALQLAHCHPNGNVVSRPTMLPGGVRETYVLNMTCINGQVAFSARNAAGKVAMLSVGKEKLYFEPKHFGIFLRSDDDGEWATASIDNVRFTGQPNREKLKEVHAQRRLGAIQQAREEYLRARATPALEQAERAGSLGPEWHKLWRQNGGAGVGRHNDRDNVWCSHPHAVGRHFIWRRKVNLEAGKNWTLRFDVSGAQDFQLAVRANDQELVSKVISGRAWQTIEVPLSKFAGGTVWIELQNQVGGTNHWSEEHAVWDNVRITPQ